MTAHPFTAPGQDELSRCLLLNAADVGTSGGLAAGQRGTGKTTTVRVPQALLGDRRVRRPRQEGRT